MSQLMDKKLFAAIDQLNDQQKKRCLFSWVIFWMKVTKDMISGKMIILLPKWTEDMIIIKMAAK